MAAAVCDCLLSKDCREAGGGGEDGCCSRATRKWRLRRCGCGAGKLLKDEVSEETLGLCVARLLEGARLMRILIIDYEKELGPGTYVVLSVSSSA